MPSNSEVASSIYIWARNRQPDEVFQNCIIWDPEKIKIRAGDLSSISLVEKNSDFCREAYLQTVQQIGDLVIGETTLSRCLQVDAKCNFWHSSLIFEKSNYSKSKSIQEYIKFIALTKWVSDQNIEKINLFGGSCQLKASVSAWCQENGLEYADKSWIRDWKPSAGINHYFPRFAGLCFLLRLIISRIPLFLGSIDHWRSSRRAVLLCSYFARFNLSELGRGIFRSEYWGDLPIVQACQDLGLNWLHVYVPSKNISVFSVPRIIERLNRNKKSNQSHVMLDSFMSPKVFILLIKRYLKLSHSVKRIEQSLEWSSFTKQSWWAYFAEDWARSTRGAVAVEACYNYSLFERALDKIVVQRCGIYLQENQGWESALLANWRSSNHNKIFAYPHSVIRYWDLRYHGQYNLTGIFGVPICANGQLIKTNLTNSGVANCNFIDVEYLALSKKEFFQKADAIRPNSIPTKVVIFTEYDGEASFNTLQMISRSVLIDDKYQLILKPHPVANLGFENTFGIRLADQSESVLSLINKCDLAVVSATTTAGVECLHHGLSVISVVKKGALNFSPLYGIPNCSFVSSACELNAAIQNWQKIQMKVDRSLVPFDCDAQLVKWNNLIASC